jgi:hypothetical protein
MPQPARKLSRKAPPAPTEVEVQLAVEGARRPDGSVSALALAANLAADFAASSDDPHFRFRALDE